MIEFLPFQAVRPTRDKAGLVGSRSYLSYSDDDLRDKLTNNPYTFLHIINPNFMQGQHLHGTEKFAAVREAYDQFHKEGIFKKDNQPAFYLYQQHTQTHVFSGIIGALAVKDYNEGRVKKHEHTLTAREEMFKNYLDMTGFNAEPALIIHEDLADVAKLMGDVSNTRADFEFTTTDRVMHCLWLIDQPEQIEIIRNNFASLDSVYIADGHHRCSSSALLAEERNEKGMETNHNHFLAFLLPQSNVVVHEFNRLVRDLGGLTNDQFLKKIEKHFFVREVDAEVHKPQSLHEMSLYIDRKWYALNVKPGQFDPTHPVELLDCEILSKQLLEPVLGITDLRTDPRVEFLPGNSGPEELMKKVNSGHFACGFGLFPATMDQIKKVADANFFMPPKSTYIEPKLRSGLTILEF